MSAANERMYEVNEAPMRPASAEELLMSRFEANELRRWTSENGVRRNRGDNKLETARKAIRQVPYKVIEELGEEVKEEASFQQPDDEYTFLREEAFSRGADGWIILYRGDDPDGSRYVHVGFF